MLKGSSKFAGRGQERNGVGAEEGEEGKSWVGEQLTRAIANSGIFHPVKHSPAVLLLLASQEQAS